MTTDGSGTRTITKVIIRCFRDPEEPSGRRPELVVCSPECGEEIIDIQQGVVHGRGKDRTCGVFAPSVGPTMQAYTLLILLFERRKRRSAPVKPEDVSLLKGWKEVTEEGSLKSALHRLTRESAVLECEGFRARIRQPDLVTIEPEGEEAEVLAWAREPQSASDGKKRDPIAETENLLARAPLLAAALLTKGYAAAPGQGAPRRLALALAEAPPDRVARDLARIGREKNLREDACELLKLVLPQAESWAQVVEQVGAARVKRRPLILRVRTETIGEILAAKHDDRPAEFVPGYAYMQGADHIPMPATVDAPIGNKTLADAILMNLVQAALTGGSRLPRAEFWLRKFNDARTEEARKTVARKIINAHKDDDTGPYLLVIDWHMPMQGEALDRWWDDVQNELPEVLPGLRLIRLKGGEKEMDEEYEIVPHIEELFGFGR